jgi:uncharacterized protein YndB with AHSA1/START domain
MAAVTSNVENSTVMPKTAQELTFTRVFHAPRSLVFKAWIEPERLAQWWGPRSFTNPRCELDARPGGAIRIDMRGPDGTVYPMGGTFREIVEPERLVFTATAVLDADGNPQLETLNTITLTELNGKTTLTLHVKVLKASPTAAFALAGMEEGWNQTLEGLTDFVSKQAKEGGLMRDPVTTALEDQTIVGSRLFDAPRDLVFQMFTDPKHIVNWWGPKGFTNTLYVMDVRPGGSWRHVMHGPDGVDYKNESEYVEVVKPERLVYKHLSAPGHVTTITFEDRSGKTQVTMRMLFASNEVRDNTIKVFGAVEGLKETLNRLAEHLETM